MKLYSQTLAEPERLFQVLYQSLYNFQILLLDQLEKMKLYSQTLAEPERLFQVLI